jgi:acetoin utilization protein AcuB
MIPAMLMSLALAPQMTATMWRPIKLFIKSPATAPVTDESKVRVADIMTKADRLVVLSPDMRFDQAACRLREGGISGAPVVGDCTVTGKRRLLGVLSQKDLLHVASGQSRVRFTTSGPRSSRHIVNTQRLNRIMQADVASIMSTRLTTIGQEATVQEAAKVLLGRNINRLPVVDGKGGLVGLISTSDVMRTVSAQADEGCDIFADDCCD